MGRIIDWIKTHKLVVFLFLLVAYFVFRDNFAYRLATPLSGGVMMDRGYSADVIEAPSLAKSNFMGVGGGGPSQPISQQERMVIQESSVSLLVKNVEITKKAILTRVANLGGFMVNTNIQNPDEAATGTLVLRIPAKQMESTLEYFKTQAVKVVSENIQGEDVTDQYTDIQARMDTLQKTKNKLEEILDKATAVPDILEVQRELINLQSQIDSLKGQEEYLAKNTQMARVTVYLSTDELALPYAPSEAWRPQLIFKQSIRSLIGTLRSLGSLAIRLAVYSVIWLPIVGIIYFLKRRHRNNPQV
ncbi:hypothetical protein A3F03_03355 [Candidatus Roizmanbacteria bacterium RIFCSPHIGHO2_12_FULL_41_11]|uniref:DUF4349 domain-containing protein n=2 Tax=Candidatus Roizmaniibacteriota TaxID=1752723 RepID=A0A1F7I324_9BACT|nr:MAG: hypothetical protein A3F03_03355 [Candidatus Roizmanbacteria bacterium RIFCSPHIGHO2_12_FULL_41_11]